MKKLLLCLLISFTNCKSIVRTPPIGKQLEELNSEGKKYYYIQWFENDSLHYKFIKYKKDDNCF